jgi:hypothetical protein
MSFGNFGSRPRAKSSGIYWVNRHLESQRRIASHNDAIARFNERWKRLQNIYEDVLSQFVKPLQEYEVTAKEFQSLAKYNETARALRQEIARDINNSSQAALSKYATQIKALAMTAIPICHAKGIYNNIGDAQYSVKDRAISFDGSAIYFFG